MSEQSIKLGDGCLDLAQGRPVHVVTDTGQTVAEWSETNNHNLLDNYGNSRFDTTNDNRMFDVATVLEELFERAAKDDDGAMTVLERYATDMGYEDEAAEARELAEVDRIIGGEA